MRLTQAAAADHGCASGWTPPAAQLLVTGKLPAPWRAEKYWIDMLPGSSVELPGDVVFTCHMDRQDESFRLRLTYTLGGNVHEFSALLGSFIDLSLITGFPCVLIPRAIKPACDLPAAVLLEFAQVRPNE